LGLDTRPTTLLFKKIIVSKSKVKTEWSNLLRKAMAQKRAVFVNDDDDKWGG
jgi:hypothetical protein